jgi:hypothetical protein
MMIIEETLISTAKITMTDGQTRQDDDSLRASDPLSLPKVEIPDMTPAPSRLTNMANVSQVLNFMLFAILMVIDRWSAITSTGSWLPKLALVFLCLAVLASAISTYYARYYAPAVKSKGRSAKVLQPPPKSRVIVRPLLIGLVIVLALLVGFVIYRGFQPPPQVSVTTASAPPPKEPTVVVEFQDVTPKILVRGKTFHNERIPLDGYSYVDCTFHDCMFEYKGTAAFQLLDSRIYGRKKISTGDNKALGGLMYLLKSFGLLENMEFGEREEIPGLQQH